MSFIVTGLDPSRIPKRFATRVVADAAIGFPCRITLDDAPIGTPMLLVNYQHQPADSPYQASHAIYVSENATRAEYRDEIPPALKRRMLSLRAFDQRGMMTDAALVKGEDAKPEIERLLSDPRMFCGDDYPRFASCVSRGSL